eukprot:856824_1
MAMPQPYATSNASFMGGNGLVSMPSYHMRPMQPLSMDIAYTHYPIATPANRNTYPHPSIPPIPLPQMFMHQNGSRGSIAMPMDHNEEYCAMPKTSAARPSVSTGNRLSLWIEYNAVHHHKYTRKHQQYGTHLCLILNARCNMNHFQIKYPM